MTRTAWRAFTAAMIAGTIGTGSPALAADLPIRMPVKAMPVAAAYDWSGFYVGAHAGYGFGNVAWHRPAAPIDFTQAGVDPASAVYGGQAGVQHQFGNIVLGAEAELSGAGTRGTTRIYDGFAGVIDYSDRINYIGAVSARLGVAMDRFLVYGKFGAAWESAEHRHAISYVLPAPYASDSGTSFVRAGWVAGLGLEYALGANWSARIEYDNYRFERSDFSLPDIVVKGRLDPVYIRQSIQAVKLGINYRIGWTGSPAGVVTPAMARWAGLYVGGHGGYGWAKTTWSDFQYTDGASGPSYSSRGGLGGLQIGFDEQLGQIVVGIAADASKTDLNGSLFRTTAAGGFPSAGTLRSRVDWLGTVTGRIGVTWDNVLLYGLGGFAWARETQGQAFTFATPIVNTYDLSGTGTRVGYVAGAGAEWMLTSGWSVKAEYNRFFFPDSASNATGPFTINGVAAGPGTFAGLVKQDIDVVKIGFNYRTDGPLLH